MPDVEPATSEVARTDYVGWIAAGLVVLAVFVVAGVFWFRYHP
jgi:hypothetical protein